MTCRTTHHAGCECHEQHHAEEIARLTRERDEAIARYESAEAAHADCNVWWRRGYDKAISERDEAIGAVEQCESAQRTRAKDAERERDDARSERNVLAARVETYSAEASRLRGEAQRLATERTRADHFAALLETQGKELGRLRIELATVTADRDKEYAMRRDYELGITFETSCLSCARMLSTCRTADERAERAEWTIEGRTTPPDEATFAEHRRKHAQGWWLIASDGLFTTDCRDEILTQFADRCRARNLPWRWIPLRDDGRPTETPGSKIDPQEDPFDEPRAVQMPDTDRMYAAVVEHARQLGLGEEPDDFAILRKIDAEKNR